VAAGAQPVELRSFLRRLVERQRRRPCRYRALGWSSADYIQIHCGALCAD
jgi:hypothetical protein